MRDHKYAFIELCEGMYNGHADAINGCTWIALQFCLRCSSTLRTHQCNAAVELT